MTSISCPICAGPVELVGERPTCLIGHAYGSDELQPELGRAASGALWSAVRALEDSASGARWRLTLPNPPRGLQATIDRATREAVILRDLIGTREGSSSETEHRPDDW
jgi:hypothetical protein